MTKRYNMQLLNENIPIKADSKEYGDKIHAHILNTISKFDTKEQPLSISNTQKALYAAIFITDELLTLIQETEKLKEQTNMQLEIKEREISGLKAQLKKLEKEDTKKT